MIDRDHHIDFRLLDPTEDEEAWKHFVDESLARAFEYRISPAWWDIVATRRRGVSAISLFSMAAGFVGIVHAASVTGPLNPEPLTLLGPGKSDPMLLLTPAGDRR
jgi:hypothetical protein